MQASGLSADLEWWNAHRAAADPDDMRDLLARLKTWKTTHDRERANQGGFLLMAWDAVFGDEDSRVAAAIGELEAALSARR